MIAVAANIEKDHFCCQWNIVYRHALLYVRLLWSWNITDLHALVVV